MNLLEILLSTTLSTSALIAIALYLMRSLITTRLTKSVQNEFDSKLAGLTSHLRSAEESFKADLKRKESEIHSLQSGAIQNRLSRQSAIDKRKLDAIDQLWSAVYDLSWAKASAAQLSVLKWDAISKEVAKNPRFREMFSVLNVDQTKYENASYSAQKARPFITPVAWAYFAAYQAIIMHAVLFMKILQIGVDGHKYLASENLIKLIKTALPHCAGYIDEHGPSASYYLLNQLENSLLEELKYMLDGGANDMMEVARANQILIEVSRVNSDISKNDGSVSTE